MKLHEKIEEEIRKSCEKANVPPSLIVNLVERYLDGRLQDRHLGEELDNIFLQIKDEQPGS